MSQINFPFPQPVYPLRGYDVMKQATELLCQVRFSPHQGAYLSSEDVVVLADPHWSADNTEITVLFHCMARGHRVVDWLGTPLFIDALGNGTGEASAVVCLDERGRAVVEGLKPGPYQVVSSAIWGISSAPIPTSIPAPWGRSYRTIDDSIKVTVSQDDTGAYKIAAESKQDLHGRVRCAILGDDYGDIEMQCAVPLQQNLQRVLAHAASTPLEGYLAFCLVP